MDNKTGAKRYQNLEKVELEDIWRLQKAGATSSNFLDKDFPKPEDPSTPKIDVDLGKSPDSEELGKKDKSDDKESKDDKSEKEDKTPPSKEKETYPPIVTIDGRVDTDIDHLIDDLADGFPTDYKGPVDEIPSKFPKPHVFSVIEGSLDDDVDSYANDDGTMEHTLADGPKNFNPGDLKDVASSDASRKASGQAAGHSKLPQIESSQADRSHNKMYAESSEHDAGTDHPAQDKSGHPCADQINRDRRGIESQKGNEESLKKDKANIRPANKKRRVRHELDSQRSSYSDRQKQVDNEDRIRTSESADAGLELYRRHIGESDAEFSRAVVVLQCNSTASDVKDCGSRPRETDSAVYMQQAYTESLSCTFTDESFRDGHMSLDASLVRGDQDESHSNTESEPEDQDNNVHNDDKLSAVHDNFDYNGDSKNGPDVEQTLYHLPSYSEDSFTKSSDVYSTSRYKSHQDSHFSTTQSRTSCRYTAVTDSTRSYGVTTYQNTSNRSEPTSCHKIRSEVSKSTDGRSSPQARRSQQASLSQETHESAEDRSAEAGTVSHETHPADSDKSATTHSAYTPVCKGELQSAASRDVSAHEDALKQEKSLIYSEMVKDEPDRGGVCASTENTVPGDRDAMYPSKVPSEEQISESSKKTVSSEDCRKVVNSDISKKVLCVDGGKKVGSSNSLKNAEPHESIRDSSSPSRDHGVQVKMDRTLDEVSAAGGTNRMNQAEKASRERQYRSTKADTSHKSNRLNQSQSGHVSGHDSDTESLDSESHYLLHQLEMAQMTKRKANTLLKRVQHILEHSEHSEDKPTSDRRGDIRVAYVSRNAERELRVEEKTTIRDQSNLERFYNSMSVSTHDRRVTGRESKPSPARDKTETEFSYLDTGDRGLVQTLVSTWDKHHRGVNEDKGDNKVVQITATHVNTGHRNKWMNKQTGESKVHYVTPPRDGQVKVSPRSEANHEYRHDKSPENAVNKRTQTRDGDIVDKRPRTRDGEIVDKRTQTRDGDIGNKRLQNKDGDIMNKRPQTRDGDFMDKCTQSRDGDINDKRPRIKDGDIMDKCPHTRDEDFIDTRPQTRDGDIMDKRSGTRDGEDIVVKRCQSKDWDVEKRPIAKDGDIVHKRPQTSHGDVVDKRQRRHSEEVSQSCNKNITGDQIRGPVPVPRRNLPPRHVYDSSSLSSDSSEFLVDKNDFSRVKLQESSKCNVDDAPEKRAVSVPRKLKNSVGLKRRASPDIFPGRDVVKSKRRSEVEAKRNKFRSSSIKDSLRAAFKIAEESMNAAAKVAEALNVVMRASQISPHSSSSLDDTDRYVQSEHRKSPALRSKRGDGVTAAKSRSKSTSENIRTPKQNTQCANNEQKALASSLNNKTDGLLEALDKKTLVSQVYCASHDRALSHKTSLFSPSRTDTFSRNPKNVRSSQQQREVRVPVNVAKRAVSQSSVTLTDCSAQIWADTAKLKHSPRQENGQQHVVLVAYSNSPDMPKENDAKEGSKVLVGEVTNQENTSYIDSGQHFEETPRVGDAFSIPVAERNQKKSPPVSDSEVPSKPTLTRDEWIIPGSYSARKIDAYFTQKPPVIDQNLQSMSLSAKHIIRCQLVGSCVDPGLTDSGGSDSIEYNSNFNRSAPGTHLRLSMAQKIEQQQENRLHKVIQCSKERALPQTRDDFVLWHQGICMHYENDLLNGHCGSAIRSRFSSPQDDLKCGNSWQDRGSWSRQPVHEKTITMEDDSESPQTPDKSSPCVVTVCYVDVSSTAADCIDSSCMSLVGTECNHNCLPHYGDHSEPQTELRNRLGNHSVGQLHRDISTPAPKPRARKLHTSDREDFPLPARVPVFSPIYEEMLSEDDVHYKPVGYLSKARAENNMTNNNNIQSSTHVIPKARVWNTVTVDELQALWS